MEEIQYTGNVFVLNHKYPEDLVNLSVRKLEKHGIKNDDIILTDSPENVEVGNIVVEIFPYHLDVARIRTVRNDSFISGTIITIELETDEKGDYIE